jgi:hypothetical protein
MVVQFLNRKYTTVVIVIILALFLSGCVGGDKIGDILSNPGQYDGKEVNINGAVTDILSIPFVSQGAYKIDDGTGSIWVVTTRGTPAKGNQVSVKGTVRTAFSIGTISLGTVVFEDVRT